MCQSNPAKSRLLFRKHYNLVSGEIESGALELSKSLSLGRSSPVDVERGIAMTLLEEHTPMEVRTVLQSICKEPERAEKILESLV